MRRYLLAIQLKSDATFSSGEGLAGAIDTDVQHDEYGFPFLGGRTLKGLLAAAGADILFAMRSQVKSRFENEYTRLFGRPGSKEGDTAILHVGDARLPIDLHTLIAYEIEQKKTLTREEVLKSLTATRRQTAIDEFTGAPKVRSLRSSRVILRETPFESELIFFDDPTDRDMIFFAAIVKAFRQAGTGGNRGRGALVARLYDGISKKDVTDDYFARFRKEVCG